MADQLQCGFFHIYKILGASAHILELDNRHNSLLQRNTAVNIVHATTLFLYADIVHRCETDEITAKMRHWDHQHMFCSASTFCQNISAIQLSNVSVNKALFRFVVFLQRFIRIQESMICGNQNVRAAHIVYNQAHQILKFQNCLIAGIEYLVFCCCFIADCINSVVININNTGAADFFASFRLFHRQK